MQRNDLTQNSTRIYDDVHVVKSKRKETNLNNSSQVFDGGITVVVDYGNTKYVKITDGVNTFSTLPKVGQGGGGGGDASTLNGQPGSYYRNRDNHTGTQSVSTITGLGTAATADSDDFATAAQGAKADTAVQPGDLPLAPTWATISGKPAVVAEGATQAAARSSIGAGTSNLALGTTSSTAKAGDYQPTWAQVTAKPAVIAAGADQAAARTAIGAGTSNLAIGTTGSTAMAGNTPVVKSQQQGGVGNVLTNLIEVTQAQFDGLTPQAQTFYVITG